MFWIGYTDRLLDAVEPGKERRAGLLILGEHRENFVVHTRVWSEQQYVDHWRDALTRTLNGKPCALITDMRTPADSSHLVWWPMWRIGDDVVFHNQLLFFDKYEITGPHIQVQRLYSLIGEHASHNEEGVPVSEWVVRCRDIEEFLRMGGRPVKGIA